MKFYWRFAQGSNISYGFPLLLIVNWIECFPGLFRLSEERRGLLKLKIPGVSINIFSQSIFPSLQKIEMNITWKITPINEKKSIKNYTK
jgi:hypothetical protein